LSPIGIPAGLTVVVASIILDPVVFASAITVAGVHAYTPCFPGASARCIHGSGGIFTQGAVHTHTLPLTREEKGTTWRVHQREQGGTRWADAGGGKGRLNFLYPLSAPACGGEAPALCHLQSKYIGA